MKLFWLILTLSVPLAFATGCGDTANDNGGSGSGSAGNENGSGTGETGTIQSGLVLAVAPDGVKGDFYFGEDLVCEGATSCEASVEGSVLVELKCPSHLFIPKQVVGDPNGNVQVDWTDSGDWGLAPNGTYYNEADDYYSEVKTYVDEGQIYIDIVEDLVAVVRGETFSIEDEGTTYEGTISENLKKITYHTTIDWSGKESTDTFVLVE